VRRAEPEAGIKIKGKIKIGLGWPVLFTLALDE
jgi:hypothetical protein